MLDRHFGIFETKDSHFLLGSQLVSVALCVKLLWLCAIVKIIVPMQVTKDETMEQLD